MPTEAEIIAKGKADYFSHDGVYKNPFTNGTFADFNAYERGWMQSLKRDDTKPLKPSNQPTAFSVKPQPIQPAENLYALLKGRDGPRNRKP